MKDAEITALLDQVDKAREALKEAEQRLHSAEYDLLSAVIALDQPALLKINYTNLNRYLRR